MKILICHYNKISGPDATASFKIEFTVDESQSERFYNFIWKLKKGTELMLTAYETDKEEEIKELLVETSEQTKVRLNKQMHAMINDIADNKGLEATEIKETLKKYLIEKDYIKKSTSELNIKGYSAAIYYLATEFEI